MRTGIFKAVGPVALARDQDWPWLGLALLRKDQDKTRGLTFFDVKRLTYYKKFTYRLALSGQYWEIQRI